MRLARHAMQAQRVLRIASREHLAAAEFDRVRRHIERCRGNTRELLAQAPRRDMRGTRRRRGEAAAD